MIVPSHITCSADFSDDTEGPDGRGMYRWNLWRRNLLADDPGAYAEHHDKYVQFVCVNPSTADETLDDATVKRCWQRVRLLGYGAFVMTNLFAFRSTDPALMRKAKDPVGEWNDDWLDNTAADAGLIVIAWGSNGAHRGRDIEVLNLLQPHVDKVRHLDVTDHGHYPRHPLYLKGNLVLQPSKPIWENFLHHVHI